MRLINDPSGSVVKGLKAKRPLWYSPSTRYEKAKTGSLTAVYSSLVTTSRSPDSMVASALAHDLVRSARFLCHNHQPVEIAISTTASARIATDIVRPVPSMRAAGPRPAAHNGTRLATT